MCRSSGASAYGSASTLAATAVIALAMAVDRAEQRPEPVRLLGWL
jgi:hypothetical protein